MSHAVLLMVKDTKSQRTALAMAWQRSAKRETGAYVLERVIMGSQGIV